MSRKSRDKRMRRNERCTKCGMKKNDCPGHYSFPVIPLTIAGLILVLVVGAIWLSRTSVAPVEKRKPTETTFTEKPREAIKPTGLEKLSKEEILVAYKPVRIYRNNEFFCNGLLRREERGIWLYSLIEGSESSIGEAYYSYRTLNDLDSGDRYISSIINYTIGDYFHALVFFPGPKGIFKEENKAVSPPSILEKAQDMVMFDRPVYYTSLTDGKRYPCIGKFIFSSQYNEYIIVCNQSVSEKGMTFVTDKGDFRTVRRYLPDSSPLRESLRDKLSEDFSEVALAVDFSIDMRPPNYQMILQKLTDKKVSDIYIPVHIFRGDEFRGSGTFFEGPRGPRIVTAEHLFPKEEAPADFSFQKLQPFENKKYPIKKILDPQVGCPEYGIISSFGQADVIFCVPGSSSSLTEGVSDLKPGEAPILAFEVKPFIETPSYYWFTSLTTGERYPAIGSAKLGRFEYLILPCSTIAGESGSGFVNERGDLLTLSKGLELNSTEQQLSLPRSMGKMMLGFLMERRPSFQKVTEADSNFKQQVIKDSKTK